MAHEVKLSSNQHNRACRILRWRKAGLSDRNHVTVALELHGPLSVDVLTEAVRAVVERHAVLRTRLDLTAGLAPIGIVRQVGEPTLDVYDGFAWTVDQAVDFIETELGKEFDLEREPGFRMVLVELEEKSRVLGLSVDHLYCDGNSLTLLVQDLRIAYEQGLKGETPKWPDGPVPFSEYVDWEEAALQGESLAAKISYWERRIDPLEGWPEFRLPEAVEPNLSNRTPGRVVVRLPYAFGQFMTKAGELMATPYAMIAAAVMLEMSSVSGRSVAGIVGPVDVRPPEWKSTVGWFSRVGALRVRVRPGADLVELIDDVQQALEDATENSIPASVFLSRFHDTGDRARRWRPRVFLGVDYDALVYSRFALGEAGVTRIVDVGGDALRDGLAVRCSADAEGMTITTQYENESLPREAAQAFTDAVLGRLVRLMGQPS